MKIICSGRFFLLKQSKVLDAEVKSLKILSEAFRSQEM